MVTCQNEKSQLQNKEAAFRVLRAKLYELEERKRAEELDELRGERMDNSFGSQIRNYVLFPYQLVKDLRSGVEHGKCGRRPFRRPGTFRHRVSYVESSQLLAANGEGKLMDTAALQAKATDIRKDILTMITEAGSGHPGGSLSCTDILTALYFGGVMDYNPADPHKPGRDRFILAKGHAAPALYATLAHAGFFPTDELHTLRKLGTRLQGHPDSNLLPGVEVSTGSLGQGLSVAAGLAAGLRLTGEDGLVFTVLGDGECEEGQVWEAAMFAAHQKLGRLVAIIDNNELQIDGCIHDVCDPGDLGEKFAGLRLGRAARLRARHPRARRGVSAASKADRAADTARPVCVIARTVKGKGVSFMENQAGWHGKAPNVRGDWRRRWRSWRRRRGVGVPPW